MKTPRINDFDPNAKVPALKSALDNMPAIERPTMGYDVERMGAAAPRTDERAPEARNVSAPATDSSKRSFVRRSFDFYEDQISYLSRESLQNRLAGREGSMNAMVREAIDEWIKERKAQT